MTLSSIIRGPGGSVRRMDPRRVLPYLAAVAAVSLLAWGMVLAGSSVNAADAALMYLLLTLGFAATMGFWPAACASLSAAVWYNFFFLSPTGTLTIRAPADWFALFAFLLTASVTSGLVTDARQRSLEAEQRAAEATRLYELSRRLFSVTRSEDLTQKVLPSVAEILGAEYCCVAWLEGDVLRTAPENPPLPAVLAAWVSDRLHAESGAEGVARCGPARSVPLPGFRPTRLLVLADPAPGSNIPTTTLEAFGSLVALAAERSQLIEASLAAEVLRKSEALNGALLSSVSHDIRTPLGALQIATTALQDPAVWGNAPERTELLATMEESVARLNRTVGNILCMTRIEAGALTIDRRTVPAADVIQAAIEMVGPRRLGSRLHVDLGSGTPTLVCDPGLLATAVANLLDNALKYGGVGEPIDLGMRGVDGCVVWTVADRGPGLQPGEEEVVFTRFRKGWRGERAAGTGLGLSIVRALVEAHDGRVSLRPRPGGGAEAVIVLPAFPRTVDAGA